MKILNIAAYRFVSMTNERVIKAQETLKNAGSDLNLKGTILLSQEGINLSIAATDPQIQQFREALESFSEFKEMRYKKSYSQSVPFGKMQVKIKKQIIPMHESDFKPEQQAPYLKPEQLKKWYEEGRDMLVLDTRNDYEVALGKFSNALDLNIKNFSDFPRAVKDLQKKHHDKTIVSYCTGGIRCEKAARLMKEMGFKHVYQLEGGILDYFERCGGEHFQGTCFVFDERFAVNERLEPMKVAPEKS